MSNIYNFNIIAGSTFISYLNAQNSDGSYINLSGYSAIGYIKNQYGDTGIIYNLNPQCIQPLNSGTILISGLWSGNGVLPIGSFLYNVDIYLSGIYDQSVSNGDFNVLPSTNF